MSLRNFRSTIEWALMVALVFGTGAIARAEDDKKLEKGVVQIGRSDKVDARPNLPRPAEDDDQGQPAPPKFWIGLLGGPIPAEHPLRAHLDLPEGQGLLVINVVPDSPAAKAGLKQHDILLKANNNDLHEMKDVVDLVMSEGPKKGQITLEILRHNKRESVYLKPEERPANAKIPQVGFGGGEMPFQGGPGNPEDDLLRQFGGQLPFELRNLGPGVIVGGGAGGGEGFGMPNGVSISIQKQEGQPTHVTITRGKEKWEVSGDDPESLKKLPADLRPSVERMLHGGRGTVHMPMPTFRGEGEGPGVGPDTDGRLRERLERMEKRLEEMQRHMHGPDSQPAEKPKAESDQSK